jgi:preprotein translocase subunit YajC
MNVRKLFLSSISIALFAAAAPAPAAAQAGFSAGVKVADTKGGPVGTIASVDGDYVVLKTDRHEVRLPKSSFTAHQGGFIMAMTRDELNAEVDRALAGANAKITAGASVTGSEGAVVGTIESVDDQLVTLKLQSGTLVRLPRTALAPAPSGAAVAMTTAELEAAATGPAEAGTDGGAGGE